MQDRRQSAEFAAKHWNPDSGEREQTLIIADA
jgi:hypothetical protein